jgi:Rrf2 family protein
MHTHGHGNSRFTVAIHALGLAMVARGEAEGEAITSERLAERVRVHPVHVRRVLGALREAGLVTSQPGPGGGWRLTRPAAEVTLRDVYRAVEPDPLFSAPDANADCPVGRLLPFVLDACFREAQEAMEERLARVTIADVVEAVRTAGCLAAGARGLVTSVRI